MIIGIICTIRRTLTYSRSQYTQSLVCKIMEDRQLRKIGTIPIWIPRMTNLSKLQLPMFKLTIRMQLIILYNLIKEEGVRVNLLIWAMSHLAKNTKNLAHFTIQTILIQEKFHLNRNNMCQLELVTTMASNNNFSKTWTILQNTLKETHIRLSTWTLTVVQSLQQAWELEYRVTILLNWDHRVVDNN